MLWEGGSVDTLQLSAKRQLDAQIAERILGWRWWRLGLPDGQRYIAPSHVLPVEPIQSAWGDEPLHPRWDRNGNEPLPFFSARVEAAWEVVEWLYNHGCLLWLEGYQRGTHHGPPNGWVASFVMADGVRCTDQFTADTAPHAICLAAMEARRTLL